MVLNYHNLELCLNKYKIQTRPNAGHGLWLMFLLPLTLILSVVKYSVESSPVYKLSSIFSLGLCFSSLVFIYDSFYKTRLKCLNVLLFTATLLVAALFRLCFHRGLIFCLLSAAASTIIYYKLYSFVLKKMAKCFTLGEAAVFTQSYTLLSYFAIVNITNNLIKPSSSIMQMSTIVIQVFLITLSLAILLAYSFMMTGPLKFYFFMCFMYLFVFYFPVQFILRTNLIYWLLSLFKDDLKKNRVLLVWLFFSLLGIFFVIKRIQTAKKASSPLRKMFHVLILAVYVFGLLYNCSLLYLATSLILGLFFKLEVIRSLNVPPLAQSLQNGMAIFGDEKDIGIIAFTPMYLLAGCCLPLWIHPAPCDVTNSAIFNFLPLLSGVLTTGVGDTAASVVGSVWGSHRWKGSKKTVEGTVACIASQLLVLLLVAYFDIRVWTVVEYTKAVFAVILTSLIEAKTDQVDNIVLPFVMYIIFIL